ncbi:MAG: Bug family tripartite tricarboxylate transporter substrate binding protein [Xanthobacteraceae bacterium]
MLHRRNLLGATAAAAATAALPSNGRAETFPTRAVRLVVGGTPGSAPDVVARLAAQWLSERLGQTMYVENRNGASNNLAAEEVVNAKPDGYTLLLATATNAINATLFTHLRFNFIHDIAPVGGLISFPMVITVTSAFPAKTLPELLAAAKAQPGTINIGTPPLGSPQHVAGELLKMTTGANIVFVPYRGGPQAITDALGGQIQGAVGTVLLTLPHIKSGGLRPLAVTGSTRCELLPDVPTVNETVAGFEASQWTGMGAPRNTPAEIINRLNREINAGLTDDALKKRIMALGGVTLPNTPTEFATYIADETTKWGKVIRFAKLKAD